MMTVSNLHALQAGHTQAIHSLSVARSRIEADLSEPEHAPGAYRKLEADLQQNEARLAANRDKLVVVNHSLTIALDAQFEARQAAVIRAETRLDAARTSLRDAGGSKAHRKHLSDVLAAAETSLQIVREQLARTTAELSAVAVE